MMASMIGSTTFSQVKIMICGKTKKQKETYYYYNRMGRKRVGFRKERSLDLRSSNYGL